MEKKIKEIQKLAAQWQADKVKGEAAAVFNGGAVQAATIILAILTRNDNEQSDKPDKPKRAKAVKAAPSSPT